MNVKPRARGQGGEGEEGAGDQHVLPPVHRGVLLGSWTRGPLQWCCCPLDSAVPCCGGAQ